MKQYHSNIFRRVVTMVVAALLVVCANNVWAQTLTSSAGNSNSVAYDVTSVDIDVTYTDFATLYAIYNGNNAIVTKYESDGTQSSSNTSYGTSSTWYNVPLRVGDNVFNLYECNADGTKKSDNILATVTINRASSPPSLVINSSDKPVPAGGSVCSGSNVVVDAQYVGDTYDVNNWSVTGADGLDLECINEGHTLLIKDIKPGDYTVSLTLKNSDVIKTTFNVINSSTLDREETGCWDEYQVNATPAPTGFTGTWTGDGVSDKNNPMTTIKNPHGDYFWTVDNGVCKIQEKWTFVNNATGLSDIAVSQSGNCGSATLTVSHNAGVSPVWKVNSSVTSATSSGTTTSALTLTDAGTYSISVSASGEGGACPVEKFTSVTVSNLDNFDSAPEEVVVCSGSTTQIGPAPTVNGATKSYWNPSGSSVTISPNV